MKKIFILLIWACTMSSYSAWYPVMQYSEKKNQYIGIMQQAENTLAIWSYNIATKDTEKLLHTRYIPTHVQLLPSGNAFSFIDQGRIRVKEFIKRSAKSLDICEPLYNFLSFNWISNNKALFVAQQYGTFAIFEVQKNGDMQTIMQASKIDCMYPQKIENNLFYIARSHTDKTYKIKQKNFRLKATDTGQTIFKTEHAIAFLQMQSATQGFFIEYSPKVNLEQSTVQFYCCQLKLNTHNIWISKKLFFFEIPTQLLFGQDALHESIIPLLPRQYKDLVYYVSAHETEYLNLYCYNSNAHINTKLTNLFHFHVTTPLLHASKLYCGTLLHQSCDTPYLYTIAHL